MLKHMPHVSAYKRGTTVYLLPTMLGDRGYTDVEPVMPTNASDVQVIGKLTLAAFKLFKVGMPVADWEDYKWPLLKAMKARSKRQAVLGTRYVSVELNPDSVLLTPFEADPQRGGFSEFRGRDMRVENWNDPLALGSAILESFKQAR